MTKVQVFEALKEYVKGTENESYFIEFLDKQIAQATKKRTTMTKAQKENAEIVDKIYDYMVEVNAPVTINDIMEKFELSSAQKAAGIVK